MPFPNAERRVKCRLFSMKCNNNASGPVCRVTQQIRVLSVCPAISSRKSAARFCLSMAVFVHGPGHTDATCTRFVRLEADSVQDFFQPGQWRAYEAVFARGGGKHHAWRAYRAVFARGG